MDSNNSILDKIISSKKTTEIEQLNPTEVVSLLLKKLSSREEDVLSRRHGLVGKNKETLEEIGKTYNITRERVRQIENTALHKILNQKNFQEFVAPIENTVFSVLERHGGIMSEESLLRELLQVVGDNSINRQNLLFIINKLLSTKFQEIKSSDTFRSSWQISHAPIHLLKETMLQLYHIIENENNPISLENIFNKFKQTDFYYKNQQQLSDDTIIAYLQIDPKISKNPFNEFGLSKWGSIMPKRMNDKIYLVLKREGKPMHFNDIAKKINEIKFDKRKAYPPTVHNELILNEQYILVGRGIYALKEWGYKPGVVSQVLVDILKLSEKPLSRDELVKKVFEQRVVKKNTIHLALTDKEKFKRLSDGNYILNNVL